EREVTLNTWSLIEMLSTSLVIDDPMLSVVSSHAAIVIAAINNAVNSLKIFIILEMCLISEAYSSSGHTSLMNVL
ncbi:hypothetical protein AAER51_07025, partial [Acinetobacter baumannii]|uniref:hypothetical protein n=1 Tax=Acinetobacter baumannii TaxID=470 RepID=UPI0031F4174F